MIGPVRACRRGMAGLAWLLDYTVALLYSAWDGVAASRRRGGGAPISRSAPRDQVTGAPRGLATHGGAVAALSLIGALSVSVVGALWRQDAPAEAPSAYELFVPPTEAADHPRSAELLAFSPLVESPLSDDEALNDPGEVPSDATPESTPAAAVEAESEPAAPVEAASAPTPEPTPPPAPPPTPEPEPEPTIVVAAPAAQLTRESVTAAAIAAGWPESLIPELLSVSWCESRFRPAATGFGALGLMQIMPEWFSALGIDLSLALDPVTNLKVARYIYLHDLQNGYSPWASWACKPTGSPDNVP